MQVQMVVQTAVARKGARKMCLYKSKSRTTGRHRNHDIESHNQCTYLMYTARTYKIINSKQGFNLGQRIKKAWKALPQHAVNVWGWGVCLPSTIWKSKIVLHWVAADMNKHVHLHSTELKNRGTFYLYILVLSLGLCSSSSFARSYGAPGWCCSVVTCGNSIYLINLYILDLPAQVFKLTWPPGVRWANINVSFPGPPPGPTMDNVVFFFLPRLEGAGITTMWDAPSPSFLSRWEWTTVAQQKIRHCWTK